MPEPKPGPTERDRRLAAALDAVSNPLRLAILRQLRAPRSLTEIELRADGEDPDAPSPRLLARQTVKAHVDRLVAAGLVDAKEGERLGRATLEYVVNHAMIFAYAEEFRDLARLRPAVDPSLDTLGGGLAAAPARPRGPALVMVKGLEEGRAFPLAGGDRWTIGRAATCEVCLHFDPYASAENAVVARDGGRFTLADLPGSRNGTRLNFQDLGASPAPLATGDLVGVGRTLLLFRA
ncbi:MAG TPA: FHA domain-containing protein [Candidatus Thermoplasmatota archaeon]|nr:FHA domain-containing protein [Candidatus Thermoplasmatota archaeon]